MTKVERLAEQIRKLSAQEFAQLRDWILEQDWSAWDRQIDADVRAGKLEDLAEEALKEHKEGRTRPL